MTQGFNTVRVRLIAARLTQAPNDEIAADLALAAFGLNEWHKAVERVAAHLKANVDDEYGYDTPYDFTDQARAVLEAALTPPSAA